jgi:hypothetical protein
MSVVEQVDALVAKYEAIVIHVRTHANFRGEIIKLSLDCPICKKHFADKISVAS